jgi:hypothetical protein
MHINFLHKLHLCILCDHNVKRFVLLILLSPHLRVALPRGRIPSSVPSRMVYAHLFFPMSAKYPAPFILPNLTSLIELDEEYKP